MENKSRIKLEKFVWFSDYDMKTKPFSFRPLSYDLNTNYLVFRCSLSRHFRGINLNITNKDNLETGLIFFKK
jgi:hypothetical protein